MIDRLKSAGADKYLIPNEEARIVCQIRDGYLVLSNRRLVILNQKSRLGYRIDKVVPHDCITKVIPMKKDSLVITCSALDINGNLTNETVSLEFRTQREEDTVNVCWNILEEIESCFDVLPQLRDYTYLEHLPDCLTQNAILDLNTVLRDQPIHDELVHEAKKFLGTKPFLLEESLRDGKDRNNGVLFAAGLRGYYWIRGVKHGRFMVNIIVDSVEWDSIKCFTHRWQDKGSIIYAIYSPTKEGKTITRQYMWNPPIGKETELYPWLLEPLNGPWILADVAYKYSGKPMPASKSTSRFYH